MFQVVLDWEATKTWLSSTLQLTHHELHIIVGIGLYALFARLMRRRPDAFAPLLPIALLEMINEASDFTRYMVSGWPWTPTATLIDIALTLAPPFFIALLVHAFRAYRSRRSDGAAQIPQ